MVINVLSDINNPNSSHYYVTCLSFTDTYIVKNNNAFVSAVLKVHKADLNAELDVIRAQQNISTGSNCHCNNVKRFVIWSLVF